jgi:hypothetical protein
MSDALSEKQASKNAAAEMSGAERAKITQSLA